MPKNLFQEIVFTVLMVFVMVYAMICYNIALNMGGMSNAVFLKAFHELVIMAPIAFVLDFFAVGKIAKKKAFSIVDVKKAYVSAHEPRGNFAFQKCRQRGHCGMVRNNGYELSYGSLLAAFLCRPDSEVCLWSYFQRT